MQWAVTGVWSVVADMPKSASRAKECRDGPSRQHAVSDESLEALNGQRGREPFVEDRATTQRRLVVEQRACEACP